MQKSEDKELDQQGIGKMEGRADEDELSISAGSCTSSEGLLYLPVIKPFMSQWHLNSEAFQQEFTLA